MITISEKIQLLSKQNSISISALEKILGFGNGTIGKWKLQSPSCNKVKKVADHFNVSIDFLLNNTQTYSDDEYRLLSLYKELSKESRTRLLKCAETLLETDNTIT